MRSLMQGMGAVAVACTLSAVCAAQSTTLVSRNSSGVIGDGAGLPTTGLSALSADGWFVAYASFLPDLVPGDTNGQPDVFLRNRHDNTTIRVSVSSLGVQGDGFSGLDPQEFDGTIGLSLSGRYVAFASAATNLVAGDTNNATDIFVRDTVSGTTSRVSLSSAGAQGNGRCLYCAISPSVDGRYVVFDSDATNLVAGDTNGRRDVFIRDRQFNTTERVSVSSAGVQADQDCVKPSVSADGRYVVFTSGAGSLVPTAVNPGRSVFLRDRTLGQTFLIGVSSDSSINNSGSNPERAAVSDDGRYVAFASNDPALVGTGPNANRRTFVKDRQTGLTSEASIVLSGPQGHFSDFGTAMSPDGRFVGFASLENGGCGRWQAYVRDRTLGTTTLVSVSPSGQPGDAGIGAICLVSANGGIAVFDGDPANLVVPDSNGRGDVFVRDMTSGVTTIASVSSTGFQGTAYTGVASGLGGMTPDAAHVVLISNSGNLSGCFQAHDAQVYVRDTGTGITELISAAYWGGADTGASDGAAISDDGRFVAFTSESSQIVAGDSNNARDVFLRDRQMQTTTRISVATDGSQHNGVGFTDGPSISGDGRYVVFHSDASNLAGVTDTNGSEDVFVRDTLMNTTTLLSRTTGGLPGNSSSYGGVISGDGLKVAFTSDASNLVPGDSNGHKDVFVVTRSGSAPVRVSLTSAGTQPDLDSFNASISGDGRFVAFISTATNMVFGDTNNVADVFVRDTVANTTVRVSVDSNGAQADGASFGYPVISRDGHSVVFCSDAANLVPGDTNNATDTFVHNLVTHRTIRVSVGAAGQQGDLNGGTGFPASTISSDGRYVGFTSFAGNLVPDDTNNASDAFIRDIGPACPADIGQQGGIQGSDGALDNNDFIVFIDWFFSGNPLADRGVQGGVPGSDGLFDNNDFIVYIDQFFTGC